MWAQIIGVFFKAIINGILQAYKDSKRDAVNIKKGSDVVIKEQLKDVGKRAQKARKIAKDVHGFSDDDIDQWLLGPDKD